MLPRITRLSHLFQAVGTAQRKLPAGICIGTLPRPLPQDIYATSKCREFATSKFSIQKKAGLRNAKSNPSFRASLRRRWVHIDYPPTDRSVAVKLCPESNKIAFVCNGYVSHLNIQQLPEDVKLKLQALRNGINRKLSWRHSREIPFNKIEGGLEYRRTPCVAFSKTGTHDLFEAFTMEEFFFFESLIPAIREAFKDINDWKLSQGRDDMRHCAHEALGA